VARFVYPTVLVEANLSGSTWTNLMLEDDVAQAAAVRIAYGISGDGPLDCVAGTGECSFDLHNAANQKGRPLGFYSPVHRNVRGGWAFGVPVRVRFQFNGATRTKFYGKIWDIDPDPGLYGPRRVHVTAYDGMRDLAEAEVREVAIQLSKTEADLVTAVLDATPTAAQPLARSIDTGVDTFPYAFHDVGAGEYALALLKRIAVNSFALIAMKGDGTLMMQSRATRATGASAFTLDDTQFQALSAPHSADSAYNIVRVTIHPKTVDAAATTVLWAATGTAPSIPAGTTIEIWADYRDPANTTTLIGGTAVVNPLVSGTDFAANTQADGLGADISASIAQTVEPFASTAKISLTNNHATATAYLVNGAGATLLQIRGKGIYDRGPQTFEASTTATISRQLPIDLDYQSDGSVAQSYASYVQAQYVSASNRVEQVTFLANSSADLMAQALAREPGDVITISESVTGLSRVDAVIQSVELTLSAGGVLWCTWTLAPAAPFRAWVLGVTGRTELGQTTVVGF
jgi:hypothetical protein